MIRYIFLSFFTLLLITLFFCGKNFKDPRFHNYYSKTGNDYELVGKVPASMDVDSKIYGGIVSHDIVAFGETAKYFENIKNQDPDTVFILGPSHYEYKGIIRLSKLNFRTPFGDLETDNTLVEKILDNTNAVIDEHIFKNEHSISAIVPFIKFYFKKAKIVPIIIGEGTPRKDLDTFADSLMKIVPENAIVLASVDFSHYLSLEASDFHDRESISTIENFDLDGLEKLEIDGHPEITVLLEYLQNRGAEKIISWRYNSAYFKKDKYDNRVSSYFYAYFTKGERKNDSVVSVLNLGESAFGKNIGPRIEGKKDPFGSIRGENGLFLQGVDFLIMSLRGPIFSSILPLLKENQVNIVDLSVDQFSKLRSYFDEVGISSFGGGKLGDSYVEAKSGNKKIAFVRVNSSDENNFDFQYLELINTIKKKNDFVVANIYWGNEDKSGPTENQKKIAHEVVDSGADLIIGRGPVFFQPLEVYREKPIFYSIGDFYNQNATIGNKGLAIGAIFESSNSLFVYIFPFQLGKYQPSFLSPLKAELFCQEYLKNYGKKIVSPCVLKL